MGWESFGVVGFDLGPLHHGQTRIAKLIAYYWSWRFGMVNQPMGNHELGIYCSGQIWPWAPPSRSNEDSQT